MNSRSATPWRLLLVSALLLSSLGALVGFAGPASAAPTNDAFANRQVLAGTSPSAAGSNVDATVEVDEPDAAGEVFASVWYSWTAPFTGAAIVNTKDSDFDTQLAVYTGATLGGLTEVDQDDDGGPNSTSRVDFDAVQGVTYQLQVTGYESGEEGTVRIKLNPVSFNDVSRTHPFWQDVEWVSAEGVAQGYLDGGYHPQASITRAAMSAFLYRLDDPSFVPPAQPTFDDVGTTHPFYEEIEWMNAEGITTGYAGDLYKPNSPVTRQAMAAFLFRFEAPMAFDPPEAPTFVDVGLGHTFFTEIEWMDDQGITTGYPGGLYKPAVNVSRAAMAAFLYRYWEG
jgi:hypothetical protein